MQPSVYQSNRQQLLLMSASIFVSVTAAVIVSTILVMSLMRGEIASALNSTVKNTAPATTQVASSCIAPASEQQTAEAYDENSAVTPVAHTASAPLQYTHQYTKLAAPTHHSFNNTSTTNSTTTNNITNTELHKTTIIKDSFNKGSYNDKSQGSHNTVVVKDNTVNVNSNNTTTTTTNSNNTKTVDNSITIKDNTLNVNSNNVTDSNNTYTKNSNNTVEILSDNTVTLAPAMPPVLPITSEVTPAI